MSTIEQTDDWEESDKQELRSLLQNEPALLAFTCLTVPHTIPKELRSERIKNFRSERNSLIEQLASLEQRADIVRLQRAQHADKIVLLNKEDYKQGLFENIGSFFSFLIGAIPQKPRFDTSENWYKERTLLFAQSNKLAYQIREVYSTIDLYTKAIISLTDN
jgi:Rps23 Pro-64 3,4-dihydroxylase Tpa1-like proline 4-hydroxylase